MSDVHLLFICSPSAGILDNWIPIFSELKKKKKKLKITAVFSVEDTINSLKIDNILSNYANRLFDNCLIQSRQGNWYSFSSLNEGINSVKSNFIYNQIFRVIQILNKYQKFKFLSKILYFLIKNIELSINFTKIINFQGSLANVSAVCYDIHEELKVNNFEILNYLKNTPRFSIGHGIGFQIENLNFTHNYLKNIEINKDLVTIYLLSEKEKKHYKDHYKLDDNNFRETGIIRHSFKWINEVQDYYSNKVDINFDNYIYLISRPTNRVVPRKRKKIYLENIKKIAEKNSYKIIIKRHPKEKVENIYEEVLGRSTYGKSWIFSDFHQFALGPNCVFAITYISSICLDMTRMNIPTIEYLNLDDLDINKIDTFFDKKNRRVEKFRYFNLVLGCSDEYDFIEAVNSIKSEKNQVMKKLRKYYNQCYYQVEDPIKLVSDDIIAKIN